MTTTATPAVPDQSVLDGLSADPIERDCQTEYVAPWNLMVDAYPRNPKHAWHRAGVEVRSWREVDGLLVNQTLTLTVKAALKLRDMLNAMEAAIVQQHTVAEIGAAGHRPRVRGRDGGQVMSTATGAHTPGPWAPAVSADAEPWFAILADDDVEVAAVWYDHPNAGAAYPEREVARANARLIASAPDLLDTLTLFVGDNGHETMCRGHFKWVGQIRSAENCSATCERLRAAIAKATGGEV